MSVRLWWNFLQNSALWIHFQLVFLKKCLDPLLPQLTNIVNSFWRFSLISEDGPCHTPHKKGKHWQKWAEELSANFKLKVPVKDNWARLSSTDQHLEAVLVLLDFSAAFDTLSHSALLQRLRERYGITGTALKWNKSYLQGRSQSVVINEEMSDSFVLDERVPQGSVNGPFMITLFSAPIGDVINAHGIKFMTYADDTQLYMLLYPSERDFVLPILELCLREIKAWTTRNRLVLNDSKTEVVHINSKLWKRHSSHPKDNLWFNWSWGIAGCKDSSASSSMNLWTWKIM